MTMALSLSRIGRALVFGCIPLTSEAHAPPCSGRFGQPSFLLPPRRHCLGERRHRSPTETFAMSTDDGTTPAASFDERAFETERLAKDAQAMREMEMTAAREFARGLRTPWKWRIRKVIRTNENESNLMSCQNSVRRNMLFFCTGAAIPLNARPCGTTWKRRTSPRCLVPCTIASPISWAPTRRPRTWRSCRNFVRQGWSR